jgi:hypothetical protein
MSEVISFSISPTRESSLLAINIPSIAAAVTTMESEILDASELLPKIQEASISLEEVVRNSHFVDINAHNEATALKHATHKLDLIMSEIQERMKVLETLLRKSVVIPPALSTADDISVAFHLAVNGPEINWPFAEEVLQIFVSHSIERFVSEFEINDTDLEFYIFKESVWKDNEFDDNMVKLLNGGDCWRLRKSLKLLSALVDPEIGNCDFKVSIEIFNSLASVILHPTRSSLKDDEIKWVHLISKNQEKAIDQDITRLINSFLYSRNEITAITSTAQRIIYLLINDKGSPEVNEFNFRESRKIPIVLVKILEEERRNPDFIEICLLLSYMLISQGYYASSLSYDVRLRISDFIQCGICEALLPLIDIYISDADKINEILYTILCIIQVPSSIPRLITAGLLKALVQIFECERNSWDISHSLSGIIKKLCVWNKKQIVSQFRMLGIRKRSGFYD